MRGQTQPTRAALGIAAALLLALVLPARPAAADGSGHGSSTDMPAYYDATLFTINFQELSSNAEVTQLQHNHSINNIYQSDGGLPGGQPFISVIDAIQTDGFNPIWQEIQIIFNPGVTPVQYFSDDEVLAAAAAGQITLIPTNEVYTCSVVGTP
jgi:hypothetical protein